MFYIAVRLDIITLQINMLLLSKSKVKVGLSVLDVAS